MYYTKSGLPKKSRPKPRSKPRLGPDVDEYPGDSTDGRGRSVSSAPIITPGEKAAAQLVAKLQAENEELQVENKHLKEGRIGEKGAEAEALRIAFEQMSKRSDDIDPDEIGEVLDRIDAGEALKYLERMRDLEKENARLKEENKQLLHLIYGERCCWNCHHWTSISKTQDGRCRGGAAEGLIGGEGGKAMYAWPCVNRSHCCDNWKCRTCSK